METGGKLMLKASLRPFFPCLPAFFLYLCLIVWAFLNKNGATETLTGRACV
jgi:hypothetical protein